MMLKLLFSRNTSKVINGSEENIKITTAEDFERVMSSFRALIMDIRIGNGFDVHAFEEGKFVILGRS